MAHALRGELILGVALVGLMVGGIRVCDGCSAGRVPAIAGVMSDGG
jgi:hypothetical protein